MANVKKDKKVINASIISESTPIKAMLTTFSYATTTKAGIIRIATNEEAITGTDNSLAITPYTLSNSLSFKQDIIDDLSIIRSNAEYGNSAYNTISGYGDIVSYNATYFATANQGALADTALQPNDNISELVNDSGYITNSAIVNMQTTTNLVTSLSGSSTDVQYPSAKCMYDLIGNIETLLSQV
jgi:hypothetical protein